MIRSYEKNGYTIEVHISEWAESPDEYCPGDDDIFVVAFNRSYFWVEKEGFSQSEIEEMREDGDCEWEFIPLYAYIHSGVRLSLSPFGCRWDSGQVGWVVKKPSISQDRLKSYVERWDTYASGEVYEVLIMDSRGDTIESCGNLYGDEDVEAFVEEHLPAESCEEWTEVEAIEHLRACLKNLLDRGFIGGTPAGQFEEVEWCLEKTKYWAEKEVSNG